MTKFVSKNPRTDNLVMFNSVDCVDKCLCRPWRFPLREVINWSHSSLRTRAVRYILISPSSTQICIDSHLIACCFLFLLLPVVGTFFQCASRVIFLVATHAALWWTNWCLRCCCVSLRGALLETPVVRLDSTRSAPRGTVSGAMACGCRNVRRMITERICKC
jgi:hypothetical protein